MGAGWAEALTPTLSPQGVRKNARLSTGYGERGRVGADSPFSLGEKVASEARRMRALGPKTGSA